MQNGISSLHLVILIILYLCGIHLTCITSNTLFFNNNFYVTICPFTYLPNLARWGFERLSKISVVHTTKSPKVRAFSSKKFNAFNSSINSILSFSSQPKSFISVPQTKTKPVPEVQFHVTLKSFPLSLSLPFAFSCSAPSGREVVH